MSKDRIRVQAGSSRTVDPDAATSEGSVLARPPAFTRESLRHINTEVFVCGL